VKKFFPVSEPTITREDKKNAFDAINSGFISSEGKYNKLFENSFSNYIGSKYAIALSNGTVALETALYAIGIEKGDEVILPNFTIVSCLNSIIKLGAIPIFVDVDKNHWNIDHNLIEKKITKRTKAIIVCHIFGHPAEIKKIIQIRNKYNIKVIEDCAESHGAEYKGKKIGNFGDISTFSFYSNKLITTGEGGMVLTSNKKFADRARGYKNLFFGKTDRFKHKDLGSNYRLTNIQAAIGYSQTKRINSIVEKKRKIGFWYLHYLKDINKLELQKEMSWAKTVFWMYAVVIKSSAIDAKKIINAMAKRNIQCRPLFYNLNKQPFLSKFNIKDNRKYPVTDKLAKYGFYLPSSLKLTKKDVVYIVNQLKEVLDGNKK
jgi:perosamine synthetase